MFDCCCLTSSWISLTSSSSLKEKPARELLHEPNNLIYGKLCKIPCSKRDNHSYSLQSCKSKIAPSLLSSLSCSCLLHPLHYVYHKVRYPPHSTCLQLDLISC
ncbi:hypothetical protein OIU79_012893 [Salix purpurea]|uniref:Uncharacterized protein n=1 Tax=Salix purpurea TaxID=77065 RepID=A0A9Q0Q4C4_SALPP|nr:hypothetical protein OIU79_012893 [Salix purpurea]